MRLTASRRKRRTSLRLMSAVSMTMICAACATSPAAPVYVPPTLPQPPGQFGSPIDPPTPEKGQSAVSYAAKTLGALAEANRRLANDGAFYRDLQASYASPPP